MKGNDFLYLGLGAAALYLVYKLSKPVTEFVGSAGGAASDIIDTGMMPIRWIGGDISSGNFGANPYWNLVAPIPTAVIRAINGSSQPGKTGSSQKTFLKPSSSSVSMFGSNQPTLNEARNIIRQTYGLPLVNQQSVDPFLASRYARQKAESIFNPKNPYGV